MKSVFRVAVTLSLMAMLSGCAWWGPWGGPGGPGGGPGGGGPGGPGGGPGGGPHMSYHGGGPR